MREITEEFNVGVFIDSDGRNKQELIAAIKMLQCDYDFYKGNCRK